MLIKTVRIRRHEVGLWFRHGDLHRVLDPGVHRRLSLRPWSRRDRVEIVDTLETRFCHDRLEALVDDQRLAPRLVVVNLRENERAIVWIDGRLGGILSKGLHAFWATPRTVEVERYNVDQPRFEHPKLDAIMAAPGAAIALTGVRVEAHQRLLVFRNGQLVDELGPGHFVFWRGGQPISWVAVDLREQLADVQGQEIMTADKVTLRLNLVVTHRVSDARLAVTAVADWEQALYRAAQLELRAAVGGRTLEKLLADKDALGDEMLNRLRKRAGEFGVSITNVGLRDVILPGDMKMILNEVIVAQKQAEANLIRRREETAAARSQANTAKLLAENPVLARMKELELLQDILRGSNATFVLGSGDLASQLGALASAAPTSNAESRAST